MDNKDGSVVDNLTALNPTNQNPSSCQIETTGLNQQAGLALPVFGAKYWSTE